MARPTTDRILQSEQTPFVRAEEKEYVERAKSADLWMGVSQYLFWGATTLFAAALAVGFGGITLPATMISALVGTSLPVLGTLTAASVPTAIAAGGALASIGLLGSSLMSSRHSTKLKEQNSLLMSDIDSQNQARRMVQAFGKAKSTQISNPFEMEAPRRSDGKSWTQFVGEQRAAAQAVTERQG